MLTRLFFTLLLFLTNIPPVLASERERGLDYKLEVSFDIQESRVSGLAEIPLKKGQEIRIEKGGLKIVNIGLEGQKVEVSEQGEDMAIVAPRDGTLEIGYEGVYQARETSEGTIGDQGIFLTGIWYPKPRQLCVYHLTVSLPEGYEAVSEAETVRKLTKLRQTIFSFEFPHPLDGINLMATNRYEVAEDHFDGVEIFVYFFPEDRELVKTFIEHTKRYLKLYRTLIDRFPYKRFSIVENFLPTGYSMPTYTLLGQGVMRLPFIPETSLGHEILHQWFGNLVYIDYTKGNWAEGLTTFLADHLYEEEKGRGAEYRKGMLIQYQSYVNGKNEFPLRGFRERTDEASEAIGYGKALMVFQMLKGLVGEGRFYESIRYFTGQNRFRKASWEDIQRAFEKSYQENLDWFFKQWIDGNGLPDLRLEEVQTKSRGAQFETTFTIAQEGKSYRLNLPVTVRSCFGQTTKVFSFKGGRERYEMTVDSVPVSIAVDEDYEVARMLSAGEFPPVIARLIGDEKRMIVLPPEGEGVYGEVIDAFKGRGTSLIEPERINYAEPGTCSLIILGADNPAVGRLYGSVVARGGFGVLIKENPWNRRKVVGIFDARSEEELSAAFQKVFHYGKYSTLFFNHGHNVYKKIDESADGIMEPLVQETVAVEVSELKALPEIMAQVADKKVIYIGETHDRASHHVMELEVIKDLHRRGKMIAIGMEMFQRPFQKVVDEYIEGRIDEREFLKGTEYFKRWGYDYHLYRPILDFARSEKIPVIALNQRQEMVDKVFENGLDSLSEEERKSVPSRMDFSDEAYKRRLEKIFQEHKDIGKRNFNFFFQAQILWDETMSEAIDEFLKGHPDGQMVVLAGSGHLEYGSGIPRRTVRRNGYDYAIILNDVDLEKGIADYVLFPGPVPGKRSPELMVFVKEADGRVEITGFPKGSVSEKAGMKVGDILAAIDQTPIKAIEDLKIELLSKKMGERVVVKILRKGFFNARQEIRFEVVLH
jgi:uncharacterized iron-regulated protein